MKKFVTAALLSSAALVQPVSAAPIVTLYNTGVTDANAVKNNNDAETHYTLVGAGLPALRVATSANGFPIGPWLGDNATSAWVGPVGTGDLSAPAGSYTYRTTFSLDGFQSATAKIVGRWSTDDTGLDIILNGTSLNIGTTGNFQVWSDLAITSGFVAGLNTLDFVVSNGGGPTGLRTELVGTAAAVPEPATWGMMILGFGAVGAAMRRRKSAVRTSVRFA